MIDPDAALRLLLLYAHLLLCVFALQRVLATDWAVLRGRIDAAQLYATHRLIVGLLAALWASGLAIAALDFGFDPSRLHDKPKLIAKVLAVSVLTANGVLLRCWCFPRLAAGARLQLRQELLLVCAGAISTSSWLWAALLGIARPMQNWPLPELLGLHALVLGLALMGAAVLALLGLRRVPTPSAPAAAAPRSDAQARASTASSP